MSKPRKWDLADLPKIVEQSFSVREVIQRLGLIPAGGNYEQVQKFIKQLNLCTAHFKGKGHLKGKTHTYTQRPVTDYTEKGVRIQSHKLKLRLLKEGIFTHRCNRCGITEWNGLPTPIELEHKDGNHHNNSLNNLELLCPNCHAQTDTYRGKNKRSR
jgi:hypothetical protein